MVPLPLPLLGTNQLTPFEVVYGRPPPTYATYIPGESSVAAFDQSLRDHDAMIRLLKANLIQAQARMKMYVDQKKVKGHLK